MILILASAVFSGENLEEALALSRAHVARSRTEPGCISHDVHRDGEDPRRLVFVEKWASSEALAAHFRVPESRAFAKALASLATARPFVELYDASAVDVPGQPRS